MAIYHFKLKNLSRTRGEDAVTAAAYRACCRLWNNQEQKSIDYRKRKKRPWYSKIIPPKYAPTWASDIEQLWNAANAAEVRKNSRIAREVEISLPSELSLSQQQHLVLKFVQDMFVQQGMIAHVFLYKPQEPDGLHFYAQVLLTTRQIEATGFSRTKNRYWGSPHSIHKWREKWAIYVNGALEQAGLTVRVDHRTLKAQGIDREPTKPRGTPKHQRKAKSAQRAVTPIPVDDLPY